MKISSMQFGITLIIGALSLLIAYLSYGISNDTDSAIAKLTEISTDVQTNAENIQKNSESIANILFRQQYIDFRDHFSNVIREKMVEERLAGLGVLREEMVISESFKNDFTATTELVEQIDDELEKTARAPQEQQPIYDPLTEERICLNPGCDRWIVL